MPEFSCAAAGAESCGKKFHTPDKAELMLQVGEHLRDKHNVKTFTQTLQNYVEKIAK